MASKLKILFTSLSRALAESVRALSFLLASGCADKKRKRPFFILLRYVGKNLWQRGSGHYRL